MHLCSRIPGAYKTSARLYLKFKKKKKTFFFFHEPRPEARLLVTVEATESEIEWMAFFSLYLSPTHEASRQKLMLMRRIAQAW